MLPEEMNFNEHELEVISKFINYCEHRTQSEFTTFDELWLTLENFILNYESGEE